MISLFFAAFHYYVDEFVYLIGISADGAQRRGDGSLESYRSESVFTVENRLIAVEFADGSDAFDPISNVCSL